jgi:tetratricopeptide (TPR) repeat protein
LAGGPGANGGYGWRNELGGEVGGSVVQAQAIHGDVYMGAVQPRRLPAPSQIPPAPAHFTDRIEELAAFHRLAGECDPAPPVTIVVVTGVGGVGKTSLALHCLHRARERYPDAALYADLGGFGPSGPVSPADVLGRFLRALGLPPDQVPAGIDEQAALYRSATEGRRIVALLDNAASAAQARLLFPAAGPSLVVITTRRRLAGLAIDGAQFIDVAPLGEQAAVDLLGRIVGADRARAEPDAARAVARLCGRLPLALCVSAARLAPHPRWTLGRVAEELASEQHRLSALTIDDDISVRSVFDVSYQALPPDVAHVYRLLSLVPAPSFGPGVAAAATAEADVSRSLASLVESSLLEETGESRWRFHDLVILHAREQAGTGPPQVRVAGVGRILNWYLRAAVAADLVVIPGRWHLGSSYENARQQPPAFAGPAEALDWLESELMGLLAAVELAHDEGLHETAWQLCEALWGLLVYRWPHQACERGLALGLASAQACGDRRAQARMHVYIGFAGLHLGHPDQAWEHFVLALALDQAEGHRLGEATALENLGLASLAKGDPGEALSLFTQARTIHELIANPRGAAIMTRRIGAAFTDLGQFPQAIEHLQDARQRFADLGDPYNQARTLTTLAETHLRAGQPADAEPPLAQALDTMTRLGARDEQARIHRLLADAAALAGNLDTERGQLRQALETYDALGSPQADQVRSRLETLSPASDRRRVTDNQNDASPQ